MDNEIKNLKEFIHEKFESHEELEALRFKRIDELLSQYGKESEGNAKTVVRIHQRVDQIQTSYKTLKAVGMFFVASVTAVAGWLGLTSK